MPLCRTGLHDSWGVGSYDLNRFPAAAIRLYYDAGTNWAAAADRARKVRDLGIWAIPQIHQTGIATVDGFVNVVNQFVQTQPPFEVVELGNEPWRTSPAPD